MKLVVHQPIVNPMSHTEFRQNRTMGTSKTSQWSVIADYLPDPLAPKMHFFLFKHYLLEFLDINNLLKKFGDAISKIVNFFLMPNFC